MAKLTLSVDASVTARAKRYAKQRGMSVSQMVETYLGAVAGAAPDASRDTPVLRSLRGTLKKADLEEYRRHLAARYR